MPRACLFAFFLAAGQLCGATGWSSVKVGPFVVYSQLSPKETRERAAELEQFRFSMGELLGRHELTLHPVLQVFLFRQGAPSPSPVVTRTGALAMVQGGSSHNPETLQALAHLLLEQNVGRMPETMEHGLEEFLSTTSVQGAKVTWGAPPPKRDTDWATIHWLVTNPDTYGKVRVLLSNLENNVDETVAYRNAIGKTAADADREVQAYLKAGHFPTIDAPSRPLNPERDLAVHPVDPEDMTLYLADLLNSESTGRYRGLMTSGKHRTEAEEGLALLAIQHNDVQAAANLLREAVSDGSQNGRVLLEYAKIENDSRKSRDALKDAVEADPGLAEAHFLLGQRLPDETQQIEQYKLATKLAPRNQEYWVALAKVYAAMREWPEAAKAWQGAEQAASNAEEREKMIAARLAIEGKRLDYEESEKRRIELAKQQEIARLKQQAIAEIRAAEAKVNQGGSPKETGKATVDWDDINKPEANPVMEGQITNVECAGKRRRIVLKTDDGKLMRFSADPSKIAVPDCGPHEHMGASVTYAQKANAPAGLAGDATAITLH